ncbi:endolytic transglycosylase MltG [Kiloniella laminariae]|uniref:endolytic transglycosylase MltG n=1 Tax=Kiloniella laminariae TaxID=454162 RepID=UPI00037BC300|nr:endolytic transglycosylase MltG [Kiloniella laminariae]
MSEEPKNTTRPAFLKWASFLLALIVLTCAILAYTAQVRFLAPGPLQQDVSVMIPRGAGLEKISDLLVKEGVIDDPLVFQLGARYTQRSKNLKAGEYLFPAQISIDQAIGILESGKSIVYSVTIPEGKTSQEIVDLLLAEPTLEGTINLTPDEGSLLPETYHFVRGDSRQSIIDRMQADLSKTLQELWDKRQENLPLKSPQEALILASIVEKETGIASERPLVAGVFVNRLNKSMRLQSDPTVTYGITLGKAALGRSLTRADLKALTAYNTYTIDGLPPGPIANVGRSALEAVMQPAATKYLYFVADGTGGHAFARTLKEHNKNVRIWRSVQMK